MTETAPDGQRERKFYDAASNLIADSTRQGKIIRMVYDALNRRLSDTIPVVTYSQRPSGISFHPMPPDYPAYTIAADTRTFTYDVLGRVLTANNGDAQIARTYFPNGMLATDTARIRTVTGSDFSQHRYGIAHAYDRNGRATITRVPNQLAIGTPDSIVYGYQAQLGALETVYDLQRNQYTFRYNARGDQVSLWYPGNYREAWVYDEDGRLSIDSVLNPGGTAYPRLEFSPVRATQFSYNGRGGVLWSGDQTGFKDTLTATYTGLGHLYKSRLSQRGTTLSGYPAQQITTETLSMDALANKYDGLTADTSKNGSGSCIAPFGCSWRRDSSAYWAGVGRLQRHYVPSSQGGWLIETSTYDNAGNITAVTNPGLSFFDPASERILMYAADGQLRAVHYRWVAIAAGDYKFHDRKYTFEEYRYDALGRRILYRSVKTCYNPAANMEFYQQAECVTSLIRRTIWDGDQELAEIQMLGDTTTPATTLENDVTALNLPIFPAWKSAYVDQNPYFGHVMYTPGRGIDQPLAVTRYNYRYKTDRLGNPITPQIPGPFTVMPFWNARGDATTGAFTNGAWKVCNPPTSQSVCVGVVWTYFFSAYDRNRGLTWDNWQGTLLEKKRDKSGLSYMRNRYYDPSTGRFTQEDPIGLAGGLNLYGFANGDPLNYSDPFGLCPPFSADVSDCANDAVGEAWSALASTTIGSQLIADIVAGGFVIEQRTFGPKDRCATHSCILGKTITLNEAQEPGAIAAAIGHEYEHSTQTIGTTEQAFGLNELAAWDATLRVAKALHRPYRSQAMRDFKDTFNIIQSGPAARAKAVKQWGCRAAQDAGLPCSP